MTAVNPCAFLENDTSGIHSEEMRRSYQSSLGSRYGVVNSGDLAVTANGTPNQTVNIAAGRAIVPGTSTTLQGVYHVTNDASVSLPMPTSDSSNPRIDLVVAQVVDDYYVGGSTHAWDIGYVAGTPAASPTVPATPANSIVLAQVARAAGTAGNTISSANVTDVRPEFNKFVGRWSTSGAPMSPVGACWPGDFGFDSNNVLWTCHAAGTPGSWYPITEVMFSRQIFSSQASVSQAIPAGFKEVVIRWRGKSDQTGQFTPIHMVMNGKTADYWDVRMFANGSTYGTGANGAGTGSAFGYVAELGPTGASAGFDAWGEVRIVDADYALGTGGMAYHMSWDYLFGGAATQQITQQGGGILTVPGGALTTITLTPSAGNILNGRFDFYGRA